MNELDDVETARAFQHANQSRMIGDACVSCWHDNHNGGTCPGGWEPYNDAGERADTWSACMCADYMSYEDRGKIVVVMSA